MIQNALRPLQLNLAQRPAPQTQAAEVPRDGFQRGTAALAPLMARVAANPAGNAQLATQLEALLGQMLSDPEAEAQMIKMLATLNATGQLKPVLLQVSEQAAASGTIPAMPDAKRVEMVDQMAGMIDAEFRSHGMTPATAGQAYETWEKLAQENLSKVRNSQVPPRRAGEMSSFTDPIFVKEMEDLQGSPFRAGNRIVPLIDGPASFKERERLIDSAKESIHLMSWAFYDDETGWEAAHKLAQKHKEGVEVRIVVDGQVGGRDKHHETLDFLEQQGVEVVRWRDSERPYDGQHRKVMIIDGKTAIAGGMNLGNDYSHKGPEKAAKWRDTDVLIEGPAVDDCERLFARVSGKGQPRAASDAVGSARTAVVNHVPGPRGDAHILLATLKAIQGASESIDIENAYYITTPDLRQAMLDALERGVRVRLLTNSAESVDEPIVSAPILSSLPELVKAGAEVYTKQGDTLHSKFMIVDGLYSSVGSYNLHPRSQRYEGEMTINSIDTQSAGALTAAFEKDIKVAQRISDPDQLKIPQNIFTTLAARYFFDQL